MSCKSRKWPYLSRTSDVGVFFVKCERVKGMGQSLIFILESLLDRNVGIHDLMHFSFNHRSKKKLKVALWFAIKVMFKMFQDRNFNKAQILSCVIKSIDWNLSVNRNLGSLCDIMELKNAWWSGSSDASKLYKHS